MEAVFLRKVAGLETLGYGETPKPQPAAEQVLVKVFATAIMPAEFQWEPTWPARSRHGYGKNLALRPEANQLLR